MAPYKLTIVIYYCLYLRVYVIIIIILPVVKGLQMKKIIYSEDIIHEFVQINW